jgi:hypothetical protein
MRETATGCTSPPGSARDGCTRAPSRKFPAGATDPCPQRDRRALHRRELRPDEALRVADERHVREHVCEMAVTSMSCTLVVNVRDRRDVRPRVRMMIEICASA